MEIPVNRIGSKLHVSETDSEQLEWTQEDMEMMANSSSDTNLDTDPSEAIKRDLIESAERIYHREIANVQIELHNLCKHMPEKLRREKMKEGLKNSRQAISAAAQLSKSKKDIESIFLSDKDLANAGPETSIGRFHAQYRKALNL